MCGIAGAVNWGDRESLLRMTGIQAHRGPDDAGIWDKRFPDGTWMGLGSRRLAILDLSSDGHMPMANGDGSIWITYNGEIYNFLELRRELLTRGYSFRSNSDTEVLLHLYEAEGVECLRRLNGMFAFAICDLREAMPSLLLARDHFGVKPLYYLHRGPRLAFASEVKAILQLPDTSVAVDPAALQQYLTFLWVPDPATMFAEVKKLPAGHYAVFRGGQLHIEQYWDLPMPAAGASYPGSESELTEAVREQLKVSVKRQMISDVPVGAFLSAGLDSSSIVALMAEEARESVPTFTITFPPNYRVGETTLDDPGVAARFARRLGCSHEEIVVEPDVVNLLPRLIWHMDEPTSDPAIIAAFIVCRQAREKVTVLLSGVGGDELFAGYRKYVANRWARVYQRLPEFSRKRLLEPVIASLPSLRGSQWKGLVRFAKKMNRSASLPPLDAFLMNSTYLDDAHRAALCAAQDVAELDPWETHRAHFRRVAHAEFLNQMLYVDTKAFMISLNLTYNDKMSMASSIEVRVPFLDRELAEFVAMHVPPSLKMAGFFRPTTKYILRKAMQSHLPSELLQQPKAGFAAPIDYWLAHELRDMTDDLLSESQIRKRGLFVPGMVRDLITQHRSGRHDWSMQIWQLLTLELWMQAFVDGKESTIQKMPEHWDSLRPRTQERAVGVHAS
jgi:asparagine synthase (glutamine-hydrolysing)